MDDSSSCVDKVVGEACKTSLFYTLSPTTLSTLLFKVTFMDPKNYFNQPQSTQQRHYEALRAFYYKNEKSDDIAKNFGFTPHSCDLF